MSVASVRRVSSIRVGRPLVHISLMLALAVLGLAAGRAPAQAAAPAALVKDINQTPTPQPEIVSAARLIVSGSHLFFIGTDRRNGAELWMSDGTAATTRLVRDLSPGREDTMFPEIVATPGGVVFSANYGLWRSDGTAAGTQRIGSFFNPTSLTAIQGLLYFMTAETAGYTLWRSDGTTAGTTPVKTFGSSAQPHDFVAAGNRLFFVFDDGVHGSELWTSDGTTAGTTLVKDVTAGGSSFGQPTEHPLTVVGSRVFFVTDAATNQLWVSDGTAAGTTLVDPAVSQIKSRTALGTTLFFKGAQRIDEMGTLSTGLWRSDGTAAGTYEVKSVYTSSGISLAPTKLIAAGNKLFFDGGAGQLWVSDGTAAGTVALPGATIADPVWDAFGVDVGGRLFFRGGTYGNVELWVSDGTPGGTGQVADLLPEGSHGPDSFVALGGRAFFRMPDRGLWQSDGTAAGTQPVQAPAPITDAFQSSYVNRVAVGNLFFFAADDGVHGAEVWRSDGTDAGTFMLKDLSDSPYGGPISLTSFGGALYFFEGLGADGGLWRSDGTIAGTTKIRAFDTTVDAPYFLHAVGSQLLFFTQHDDAYALWRSDGSAAGTTKLVDLPRQANPTQPIVVGGRLIFIAYDGDHGREPWVSDGTAAGTRMLKDIDEGWYGSGAKSFTDVAGTIFFMAREIELWKTDGTTAGTVRVTQLPGWTNPSPGQLTAVGNQLFLVAYDAVAGVELWVSDGTAAGTRRVKDINTGVNNDYWLDPANGSSRPASLRRAGNVLLFSADDGVHGRELWRSDGTDAGTTLVRDINPGRYGSQADNLLAVGMDGLAYLTASDGLGGVEIWQTRGTAASTEQVGDAAIGPGSSNPFALTATTQRLFFAADDGVTGQELWSAELPDAPASVERTVFLPLVRR